MKPTVSVIIPIYNAQEYLKKCLGSVMGQSHANLQIILVDDGSIDNSRSIALAAAQEDSRINLIIQENAGSSAARNRGIDAATGEWLLFVDSDDFVAPDYAETMLDAAVAAGADAVCGNYYHDGEIRGFGSDRALAGINKIREIAANGAVMNCRFMWRRSLIGTHRYDLEATMKEDLLFAVPLLCAAGKIAVASRAIYHYRHNPSSISNSGSDVKKRASIKYVEKKLRLFARANGIPYEFEPHMVGRPNRLRRIGRNIKRMFGKLKPCGRR